ncbi:MAG: hypothetical protein PHP30_00915 [Bacteroidales bacterium]|nr:hypothetical protein [Bacteroidales bacterium]MDD2425044.1 hypothetical protein [Bacteroidales bacterium]MDD3988647.1 hypothetical protein [Bacteroidales bacterium]MDD4638329.1 hypothetical protein [Bacteroidales bacterium]
MYYLSLSVIVVSTAFVSAVVTSIAASRIHRMKWHTKIKKSRFSKLNYILTSFYQFNDKFYNPFSFIREFMLSALVTALIYKYLTYDNCVFDLKCVLANLLTVIVLRIVFQIVAYSKLFDRDLVG